jgi:hypothetical protein
MASTHFTHPIYVRNRHFIQEVTTLDEAFDFLDDWPEERRDVVYDTAVKACREAYSGQIPMGAAQETFRRFAKKKGILCDLEDLPICLMKPSGRDLRGG